jgi:hypothetical protein
MAVTAIAGEILDTNTTTDTFVTSSNSVVAGDVIIAFIQSEGGTTPDEPSVVGTNGFSATYTLVNSDSDVLQFYVFRAIASSSVSGTITFTFTDNRIDNIVYGFCFLRAVNTTTAQGVVQSAVDGRKAGLGGFSTGGGTLNLGAFADAGNATLGIFTTNIDAQTHTPGSGFSTVEHHGSAESSVTASAVIQFRVDNDQSVDCSWSNTTQRSFGIALEIDGTVVPGGSEGPVIAEGVGIDDVTVSISVTSFPT